MSVNFECTITPALIHYYNSTLISMEMNSVAVTESGAAFICAESTYIQTDEEKYSIFFYLKKPFRWGSLLRWIVPKSIQTCSPHTETDIKCVRPPFCFNEKHLQIQCKWKSILISNTRNNKDHLKALESLHKSKVWEIWLNSNGLCIWKCQGNIFPLYVLFLQVTLLHL